MIWVGMIVYFIYGAVLRCPPSLANVKGPPLPLASGGAGVPPGAIIITVIFTNTSPPSPPTLPPSMQRCTTSFPRCNLYLNMVLNSKYYFTMIYGYPMMFEQIRFVLWVNRDLGWYDCIFYL